MNIHSAQCASTRADSTHSACSASRRVIGALVIAGGLLVLSGCSLAPTCNDSSAANLRPTNQASLQIPDGLSSPDRSGALSIPPAPPQQESARATNSKRCLDGPPSYFSGPGTPSAAPEEVVAEWGQAWSERNVQGVLAIYSKEFVAPTASGTEQWLEQRREQIATGAAPSARLEDLKVISQDDRRIVTFVQRFGSNAVRKELTLVRENGIWRILNEQAVGVQ